MYRLSLIAVLAAGALAPAEPADILPDPSLQGWTRIPVPPVSGLQPKQQWRVDAAARTIVCTGDGGHEWLRYDKELGDFLLTVEWRFTPREGNPRYNSGIGIRMSPYAEIWHQAQAGPAAFLFGVTPVNGVLQRFNLRDPAGENRVKPAGEWNQYEIRAQGDRIILKVNGGGASTATVGLRRGYIGLEAEGYEITFRNLRLQMLD